ncbi:hypothetical protein HDU85_005880 [Gaertneriomyces sp. JEL0708]|nr:hypothetical protein HDU85_005880 [Gaertneriomyces sp. JEL0708]
MPQPSTKLKPPPKPKPLAKGKNKAPSNAQSRSCAPSKAVRQPTPAPQDEPVDMDLQTLIDCQHSILIPSPEQAILCTLSTGLRTFIADPAFQDKLNTIKQLFYVRDFDGIFKNDDLLGVYATEYIAGRSLCYRMVFMRHAEIRDVLRQKEARIVCLGAGNGSELVGIAGVLVGLDTDVAGTEAGRKLFLHVQDLARYPVLESLLDAVYETLPISRDRLQLSVSTSDLLEDFHPALSANIATADLVTSLFLLNELLHQKAKFVKFVTTLVGSLARRGLWLVIDSAGSFSETQIGKGPSAATGQGRTKAEEQGGRTYMVYHLLDKIAALEYVAGGNSEWYRPPKELVYERGVQNMRYWWRLYRKRE